MPEWLAAALIGAHGILWLVGMVASAIDYERKVDEGRAIDKRVRGTP